MIYELIIFKVMPTQWYPNACNYPHFALNKEKSCIAYLFSFLFFHYYICTVRVFVMLCDRYLHMYILYMVCAHMLCNSHDAFHHMLN